MNREYIQVLLNNEKIVIISSEKASKELIDALKRKDLNVEIQNISLCG